MSATHIQSEDKESHPEQLLKFDRTSSLPIVLQSEAAECGLACLAMVSAYYGYQIDLSSLRRRFSISAHGTTLKQIMKIASRMSLASRALRLEIDQLSQLQTPCILHWEMKHFVVLKRVFKDKIVVHDPALGERSFTFEQVDKLFTGVALELTPTSEFEPGEQKSQLKLKHFWSKIIGIKRSLILIFVLSIFLQVFAIVHPYYMQTVVDDVILRSDTNLLTVLALGFGLLLILDTGTTLLRQTVILGLSSRLNIQMAANVYRHLIRLPMDYFTKRHMGDIVSRFGSLQNIRDLLTTGLVTVFVDGIMAILTLLVMFYYDVKLTFIALAVVAMYALLRYSFYVPLRRLSEESIMAQAKENTHFMESVRAIQTIKLFGKESERQSQWQNRLADAMNKNIRLSKWNIGFDTANKFLFGVENILIIYFAAIAVTNNLFSVGMLYAYVSYKGRFISSMDSLIEKWIEFRMLELHFNRLADIVHTPKDLLVESESLSYEEFNCDEKIRGRIDVNGIGFAYSELDEPVFSNLNLIIPQGKTIAITGPSGCGKTTLLKCLMGLLQPNTGQIMIDEVLLNHRPNYRQSIAGVLQEDQLLNGTIADNIACFDNKIDMQRIVFFANLACIHDDIMQMGMQYNTLVGDMGASLSGGQKQRIVLARALYREPSILFMDEATSHLDVENEMAINNHIKQLSMTRVIVAHRPQTISNADIVLHMEHGQLVDITESIKTTKTNI